MLVLSRQRDESIIIGDNIVITIVDIRGDKVRLGIEAPKDVTVIRSELLEKLTPSTHSQGGSEASSESKSTDSKLLSSERDSQRSQPALNLVVAS